MNQQNSVFQTAIELPTLADSGIEAMAMNKRFAVVAIARVMKAQEQKEKAMWQNLEDIWGKGHDAQ